MVSAKITEATRTALDENPELAGLILLARLGDRLFEVHDRGELPFTRDYIRKLISYARSSSPQTGKEKSLKQSEIVERAMLVKLFFEWIYAQRSISQKSAEDLLRQPMALIERAKVLWWSGKKGRPVSLRAAAIQALIRREYLTESWTETTRWTCPCGDSHFDTNKVKATCQPKLESEVRILRGVLRKCRIKLPTTLHIFDDGEVRIMMQRTGRERGGIMVSPANTSPHSHAVARRIGMWLASLRRPRNRR